MANTKISGLSSASTPLTGSEIVPLNQSGVTDSVSVANLTAGRSVSASDYTASTGNFVPSTAGKGINFTSNTPAAGMTSQLLNWYEEGTWTPTYTNWTISPTTQAARYTRVGRLVTLNYTALDGISVAGASEIAGLPFTSNSVQGATVLMKDISGASPGIYAFGTIGGSATKIASMTSAAFTGNYWSFSTTYIV